MLTLLPPPFRPSANTPLADRIVQQQAVASINQSAVSICGRHPGRSEIAIKMPGVRRASDWVARAPHLDEGRNMDFTADDSRPVAVPEPSTGDLVKQLSEQVSVLARDELKLAQLEMRHKGKHAGLGIGMLGSGGLFAWYAVGCLLACAVIAISGAVAAWLAALIVGAALLIAAAAAALLGTSRLQKAVPPVPRRLWTA